MTSSDSGLVDGMDAEARITIFVDGPIAAVTLDQDACWFDKPHGSICRRLAAIAPLLAMVATTMTPLANV